MEKVKIVKDNYIREVKNRRLINDLNREGLHVRIYKALAGSNGNKDSRFIITDMDDNVYGVLNKKSLRNEDREELCTDIRTIVRGPLPENNRA